MSSASRRTICGLGATAPGGSATSPVFSAPSYASADAFGRLRVSNPVTLFDSKHLHDKLPLVYDEAITNSSGNATSTHSTTDASVRMHVEGNDDITRQTFARFNYQPGKSQLAFFTFVLDAGANNTNVTRKVGLYDGDDGVYLIDVNGTLGFAVEKNSSRTTTSQTSWSLDTMNGDGPSGVILDRTKAQILVIDYEWLGTGTVRFGFIINGRIIYAHAEDHANVASSVYMSTPNLPVHYSIDSSGAGTDASMDQICSTVISEGGLQDLGRTFTVSNGSTAVRASSVGTWYATLGLRLGSSYLDSVVALHEIDILIATNDDMEWAVFSAPTVAGTFTYGALTNSPIEYAAGATANSVTGGTRLAGGYVKNSSSRRLDLPERSSVFGASIAGVPREIILAVTPLSINLDVLTAISFRDVS